MLPVMVQTALTVTQNGGGAAEISKNYFLISSLIAPVSSLTFRTIRRTSCSAGPGRALAHAHEEKLAL